MIFKKVMTSFDGSEDDGKIFTLIIKLAPDISCPFKDC